jgi:hypothetical protein
MFVDYSLHLNDDRFNANSAQTVEYRFSPPTPSSQQVYFNMTSKALVTYLHTNLFMLPYETLLPWKRRIVDLAGICFSELSVIKYCAHTESTR